MIEELTALATATCKHCGESIEQLRGSMHAEWFHAPGPGSGRYQRHCWSAPTAWPIDETIADIPSVVVPTGEEKRQDG